MMQHSPPLETEKLAYVLQVWWLYSGGLLPLRQEKPFAYATYGTGLLYQEPMKEFLHGLLVVLIKQDNNLQECILVIGFGDDYIYWTHWQG